MMDADTFRRHGHSLVDWIADYFDRVESYPVLARVKPGEISAALPDHAPEDPEPFEAVMADFERVLVPGLTHWNHPGFLAYFPITGSAPGRARRIPVGGAQSAGDALADLAGRHGARGGGARLAATADRVAGDLRRRHLRHRIDRNAACAHGRARGGHQGRAREGSPGRNDVPRLRVYCSDQAHSSIDKAVITIGLGQESLRRIPSDDRFRMRVDLLRDAVEQDRFDGVLPLAVVATVGTTSTTSIDPVPDIAALCERERLWLHVDAAYGGMAAMLPSHAHVLSGAERADSVIVNPHKWLFTPFDLSAFYCRRMDVIRSAFALTPDYLRTREAGEVKNLMDTGIQLGRRFRALKLWMILRWFGARAIRAHIAEHIRLAQLAASWIDAHEDFERLAPVPLSVVCFRWHPARVRLSDSELDSANEELLDLVNSSGDVLLVAHTPARPPFAANCRRSSAIPPSGTSAARGNC